MSRCHSSFPCAETPKCLFAHKQNTRSPRRGGSPPVALLPVPSDKLCLHTDVAAPESTTNSPLTRSWSTKVNSQFVGSAFVVLVLCPPMYGSIVPVIDVPGWLLLLAVEIPPMPHRSILMSNRSTSSRASGIPMPCTSYSIQRGTRTLSHYVCACHSCLPCLSCRRCRLSPFLCRLSVRHPSHLCCLPALAKLAFPQTRVAMSA